LHICPLLNVDANGKLIPRFKIKGKKKVKREIVNQMTFYAKDRLDYSDKCFISHSACYQDARDVADIIESTFPKLKDKVMITDIGTTIGSHTGPGTVALFFWGTKREA
jgi:fatty acid-binding protein DegV